MRSSMSDEWTTHGERRTFSPSFFGISEECPSGVHAKNLDECSEKGGEKQYLLNRCLMVHPGSTAGPYSFSSINSQHMKGSLPRGEIASLEKLAKPICRSGSLSASNELGSSYEANFHRTSWAFRSTFVTCLLSFRGHEKCDRGEMTLYGSPC